METTNHYRIKAVDFCTSNYGYLLKVTMVNGVNDDHYKFAYIPFARFKSVLITDFLMARKNAPTAELLDYLKDAIRDDLAEVEPSFVYFDSMVADRSHYGDAVETDGHDWATKPVNRPAGIDDPMEVADRPIADHDLRIFRQVFLGKHPHTRSGGKLDDRTLAYRIIDNRLYLNPDRPMAVRDITDDARVNYADIQALRDFVADLLIDREHPVAERDIVASTTIQDALDKAIREIKHDLLIVDADQQAERDIKASSKIIRPMSVAKRDTTWNAFINRSRPVARRDITWSTNLLREIQAKRDQQVLTFVNRENYKMKLLYRSYPAMLQFGMRGRRENTASVLIQDVLTRRSARDIIRSAPMIWRMQMAHRPISVKGTVQNPIFEGRRDIFNDLRVNAERSFALREIKSDTYIGRERSEGDRDITRYLYVPRDMQEGGRTPKGLILPGQLGSANRNSIHDTVITNEWSLGRRPYEQKLYIDSVHHRGTRPFVKDAYLPFEPMAEGGGKLPRPSYLAEELLGDKQVYPDFGVIHDAIISHMERTKNATLDDLMTEGELIKKLLYGFNMEEFFLGQLLKKELPAFLMEDIVGQYLMMAHIMEELLVGTRWFENDGYLELAEAYGIRIPTEGFIIDEDFILGIKQRMHAFIESEIAVSFRDVVRPGVEVDDTVIGSLDITRPAQIVIENPLGFFEPDPSYLPEESLGELSIRPAEMPEELLAKESERPAHLPDGLEGKEPERPGHISDGVEGKEPERHGTLAEELLGKEQERTGHLEDGTEGKKIEGGTIMYEHLLGKEPERPALMNPSDSLGDRADPQAVHNDEMLQGLVDLRPASHLDSELIGELKERLAALTTGYVFAEKPVDRAAYVADIYYLGVREGIQQGHLEPEDFLKFSRFALHQAIIGEQMFAWEPAKASELLEDILAFRDPFESHLPAELVGEKRRYYADLPAELIAEKQEHYADLLSEILGDKKLADAIIMDYLVAQERIKEGFIPETMLGKEELKKAWLAESSEAQSFIYDYNDDGVLYQGDDPEFWDEGYGVPELYDPHDPFNPYYPWAVEHGAPILAQDDWIQFGGGTWERSKEKAEFYCQSESSGDSGYYRNDFSKTDYVFTVDFKVDAAGEDAAGIVFHLADPQNYMKFSVYGGATTNRHMALHKVVNGIETSMGSPMNPFNWVSGQWYQLEVSTVENRVKIKVNGRLQFDLLT